MRHPFATILLAGLCAVAAPAFLMSPALAQGQIPGTLAPAPPVIMVPPAAPPAPVPSALSARPTRIAPLPEPGVYPGTYRVPEGIRHAAKKKKRQVRQTQSFSDRVVPCTQQAQIYNVPEYRRGSYISRCAGGDY
jgi:hypothetical protein